MRADKLFAPFSFERSKGALSAYDLNINDVVTSPDAAGPNTVYVCIQTPLGDGHEGAVIAYARGCRIFLCSRGLGLPEDAAVYRTDQPEEHLGELAARAFGYPARSLIIFGVTGTKGKTSVVDIAAALLSGAGRRVATLTTDGFSLGDTFMPLSIAPNAADIQRMLRLARRKRAEPVILELSAYMLAHHAEKSIPFAAVLCTGLLPYTVHTGPYRNAEAYRLATERLLSAEAPLILVPTGLPVSDAKGRVVSFGCDGMVGVENARIGMQDAVSGTAFSITYKGQTEHVFYPSVGEGAAQNAAAATAIALAAGLTLSEIARLLALAVTKGRLESIYDKDGVRIFLDSAYEAGDLCYALHSLRAITRGKLSVLLGSVGERALSRRAPLGYAAVENADFAYFTADDPGSEPVRRIVRDMVAEIKDSERYVILPSRREAILRAVLDLRDGDTLLVLGKPRDDTQLISGVREVFCDRDVILKAVRRR